MRVRESEAWGGSWHLVVEQRVWFWLGFGSPQLDLRGGTREWWELTTACVAGQVGCGRPLHGFRGERGWADLGEAIGR